jgi:excreted virulence factor EspC (type VII ESX diderm)
VNHSAAPELRVTADDLRRHAAHLDSTGDSAATAPAQPGPAAYGQLCALVPALLAQLQAPLAQALEVTARSVRSSADAVRRAADLYEHTDVEAGESLRAGP